MTAIARWVELQSICDERGDLTVVHAGSDVPFPIARVYFLHHLPAGAARGGHAHRRLRQLIIAAHGSFRVVLSNGRNREEHILDSPTRGLFVPEMVWREIDDFSTLAICLVVVSEPFSEADYIRDPAEFAAATAPSDVSIR